MREIKTEAQTLDLSKKVTVEVSLAELIVLAASAYEVLPFSLRERLKGHWKTDFGHIREAPAVEVSIAEEIGEILASHGVEED
ncbi:hypothetical protein [Bacillus cereus]